MGDQGWVLVAAAAAAVAAMTAAVAGLVVMQGVSERVDSTSG